MGSTDKKCSVLNCGKERPDVILHNFPNPDTDADRFRTWINAVGGNILSLDNDTIFKYRRVCRDHFERRYHLRSKRLACNAVPTLKLRGPISKMYTYEVLYSGYSHMNGDSEMIANCSCTLLRGPNNIIVDTMTPWDSQKILDALRSRDLTPDDINYVVSTHGHSDHVGNNNLFLRAQHIVGHSISFKDTYYLHPFHEGTEYVIDVCAKIVPTPGHTLTDVTVLVETESDEIVAVTGDLFECFEDIDEPSRWLDAGSENPHLQRQNRYKIAQLANHIVPGHGKQFIVTPDVRNKLKKQASE